MCANRITRNRAGDTSEGSSTMASATGVPQSIEFTRALKREGGNRRLAELGEVGQVGTRGTKEKQSETKDGISSPKFHNASDFLLRGKPSETAAFYGHGNFTGAPCVRERERAPQGAPVKLPCGAWSGLISLMWCESCVRKWRMGFLYVPLR